MPLLTPVRKAGSSPRFEQLSGFLPGKAGALPVHCRCKAARPPALVRGWTGGAAGLVREKSESSLEGVKLKVALFS